MTLQAAEMAALAPLDTMADTMLDQVRGSDKDSNPRWNKLCKMSIFHWTTGAA